MGEAPSARNLSLDAICATNFLFRIQPDESIDKGDGEIDILIAGCGTGQHSIATAQRYGMQGPRHRLEFNKPVLRKRKTQELELENIEYAQADTMSGLGSPKQVAERSTHRIGRRTASSFRSAGRMAGAASLLRPGGFMRLGFYSKFARQNEAAARLYIAKRDISRSGRYSPLPPGLDVREKCATIPKSLVRKRLL